MLQTVRFINNFLEDLPIWILTLITFLLIVTEPWVLPFYQKYLKEDLQFTYAAKLGWIIVALVLDPCLALG
jgi:hypothetical protein